jgi:PQQ-dependent dehydrogenase (s-GDH family)
MRPILLATAALLLASPSAIAQSTRFNGEMGRDVPMRVLATGLSNPFEVVYGPDGRLWVTERTAGRITRVDPSDGSTSTLLEIDEVVVTEGTQDGLLGLALHPEFLTGTGNDQLFVAYSYDADPGPAVLDEKIKIRRYTYDEATTQLVDPVDLLTGLPASNDHNSGRIAIGPDGTLSYTIGDQGANQFARFCEPIRAQELPSAEAVAAGDWSSYRGKVLRMNLDGSIPADNPVIDGVRSHVYAYGFRNAQGLAFGEGGRLYATDHGPKSDDEVNLIEPGKNYGWPHVAGYQDDMAYVYANWSAADVPCESLRFSDYEIPAPVPIERESDFAHPDFVPPLRTFYTVESGFDFRDPHCARNELYFQCWPTMAPAGLAHYGSGDGAIPDWENSLLIPSLKHGTVIRLPLDADGRQVTGEPVEEFKTTNRYRDVAIAPDRRTFFVATDSQGLTQAADGGYTEVENPGAILRFDYANPEQMDATPSAATQPSEAALASVSPGFAGPSPRRPGIESPG